MPCGICYVLALCGPGVDLFIPCSICYILALCGPGVELFLPCGTVIFLPCVAKVLIYSCLVAYVNFWPCGLGVDLLHLLLLWHPYEAHIPTPFGTLWPQCLALVVMVLIY